MAVREAGGTIDVNTVLTATMACGIQALRLTSAADVMECFLTSERVCEDDLLLALNFPNSWTQHIVLREWVRLTFGFIAVLVSISVALFRCLSLLLSLSLSLSLCVVDTDASPPSHPTPTPPYFFAFLASR